MRAAHDTPGIGPYVVLALLAHLLGLYLPLTSRIPSVVSAPSTVLRFDAERTPAGRAAVASEASASQPAVRREPDIAERAADEPPSDRAVVTHRHAPPGASPGAVVEPPVERSLRPAASPADAASVASVARPAEDPQVETSRREGKSAADYAQVLAGWLQRYHTYPFYLRKQGVQGDGALRLRVQRDGTVALARMDRRLPDERLDAIALDMVRDANPFPPMPDALSGASFECVIEVRFQLDR